MKKYLITGGAGQLAKEFQRFFKKKNIDFLAPNRQELDITDFCKVRDYILNNGSFHLWNFSLGLR